VLTYNSCRDEFVGPLQYDLTSHVMHDLDGGSFYSSSSERDSAFLVAQPPQWSAQPTLV
jgi:hypothetical protein